MNPTGKTAASWRGVALPGIVADRRDPPARLPGASSPCVLDFEMILILGLLLPRGRLHRRRRLHRQALPATRRRPDPDAGRPRTCSGTPTDVDADWSVEYRAGDDAAWKKAEAPTIRRVAVAGVPPHRVYRAALTGCRRAASSLTGSARATRSSSRPRAKARKSADQPYRFVAFGDIAQGTPEQKAIAYRMVQEKPDFVMITGDIVYGRGRISEYRDEVTGRSTTPTTARPRSAARSSGRP